MGGHACTSEYKYYCARRDTVDPEEGTTILQNTQNYLPHNKVSQSRRLASPKILPPQPTGFTLNTYSDMLDYSLGNAWYFTCQWQCYPISERTNDNHISEPEQANRNLI
jgi:hypothetical protein